MRKYVIGIGGGVALLVALLLLYPNLLFRISEPVRSGALTLPDLDSSVTVYYDDYAVPHIYAGNEHDLFFAAGYVMASERLFQMDLTNRAVQGRLAEMNAGLVAADKYLRTWGFHHIGRQIVPEMDPVTRRIIQWSCDGINAYINAHLDDLPLEFKLAGHQPLLWDPSIVTGFSRLQGENLNGAWGAELAVDQLRRVLGDDQIRDLIPPYPGENLAGLTPATDALVELLATLTAIGQDLDAFLGSVGRFRGSNNWVVSGSRTASGYPLLANDMHLGFSQPPVWYEMHLVGGRFNVRGVFFPGLPLAMSGNNGHIAWGPTNIAADDTDFYLEEVNPKDSTTYRYRDQWLSFTEREEIIQVKDGDPVVLTVRSTVHGVIINDLEDLARQTGQPIAMRWSGQDISDEATAFLKLNLAGNWADFSAAAALFGVPGQNMVYADREGNIGWRPFVRIPLRRGGAGLRLLPGAGGEYDWQGYLPFEQLPYSYNPPEGYITTANNPTFDAAFPTYISAYWAQPFRVDRIAKLLKAREDHTPETFMAIQNDVLSNSARELVPVLLEAYAEPGNERNVPALVADALDLLRQWDYRMTTESVAATIFVAWFEELKEVIYRDELDRAGQHTYALFLRSGFVSKSLHHLFKQGDSPWFDNVNTPELEDRAAIARQALETAVTQLGSTLGRRWAAWGWGKRHTLTHPHALAGGGRLGKFLNGWLSLNVGTFPAPGSGRTVNAINYRPQEGYSSDDGPSQRSIVDLADPDNSRIVLPTGQSGNPFSPHYRDQAELYNAGQYRPVDFSREAVERAAVSTLTLQP